MDIYKNINCIFTLFNWQTMWHTQQYRQDRQQKKYLHFTLPQSLLTARDEWNNSSRGSSLEKALAMAAFGQMMKTGASINGWWGSQRNHNFGDDGIKHCVVFFRSHRDSHSDKLLVAASPALLVLEQEYKKLIK